MDLPAQDEYEATGFNNVNYCCFIGYNNYYK